VAGRHGTLHNFDDGLFFLRPKRLENELGQVFRLYVGSDTQTDPRNLFPTDRLQNRREP
jgi:hypothetical protein